jgi:hypothetical protein
LLYQFYLSFHAPYHLITKLLSPLILSSNVGCDTGKEFNENNDVNNCREDWWCDTTPAPAPARGHWSGSGNDFEEGDYLTPTALCEETEYHPHLQMQTAVTGSPNQQFYVEDNKIVSLLCPDLLIAIPDDDCSNTTTVRIKARDDGLGSEWQINDDTTIESILCPGETFDIGVADMSAYQGDSLMISDASTYFKWTMSLIKYTTMSSPFFIINLDDGNAIGVADGQCTNGIALEGQDDEYSQEQQFFKGKSGLIHSQKCHGLGKRFFCE